MSKQAVIYCRFSPRPDDEESLSLETQESRARAYCLANGLEAVSCHSDPAISGKRADNRPGLRAALESVCRMKGVLVVYSLSRLARSTRNAIEIAERLDKCGADLASVTEAIHTGNATGRMFFTILAAVAQFEREMIGERTKDAMLHHQENGLRMSDRLPYGYREDPADPTRMVPDPREQRHIELMRQLAGRGAGFREIGRMLKASGIRTRNGNGFHHTTIRRILKRQPKGV